MDDSTRSLGAGGELPTPRASVEVRLGETFGRYQVRRLLGHGGMGHVYLARDITLGRSVALKVINDTNDAGRFLDEARAIARLNHPNIVQLYDFESLRRRLVLALEYVDGVTLKDRAAEERLDVDEILHHLRAIADALAHAHASSVLHCDLKPSNVMIGRDGRVRVVDFGLAQIGTVGETGGGTPEWMAPEQWLGGAVTERVDTWALGLIAATLLTGEHPLGADADARRRAVLDHDRRTTISCDREGVSAALLSLIARSLDVLPAARPTAVEWRDTVDEILAGRDEMRDDGPYPGLTAFGERHAHTFFGREAEVDELLERLRDTACLPIVGASGTGKSSFLFAGVIPRLRRRGRWHVLAFRPGADPFGALARQLVAASPTSAIDHAELRDELVATPSLVASRLATLSLTLDASILVAIDQLEEVFTQGAPEREQAAFLQALFGAVDDPHDQLRLVFTVRDDFVGRLAGLHALFVLQPLDATALRRTITGPLARYRYELDDATLADDLVADVATTGAAALPLLQFACRTLWDARDPETRKLQRATYVAMGGVAGALARHAQRAIASMSEVAQATARKILLQLVAGTTRRSVPRNRLHDELGSDADTVLDQLLHSRLLVQHTTDGERIVEIAHESLLMTWDQLARWLDESREERRFLDDVESAIAHWERRGARVEETWDRDELALARQRVHQLGIALPPRVERFLVAGEQRHRRVARRRRIGIGVGACAVAVTGVLVGGAVDRYLAREERIRTNVGTLDIDVTLYDRDATGTVEVPSTSVDLTWRAFSAARDSIHEPGAPLPPELVHIARTRTGVRIAAPGGVVFLQISGRGRNGEACAPSWVRLQSFPGYVASSQHVALHVPTCQASQFDTIEIPAGPFIYGGPGDPPSSKFAEPDYRIDERTIDLPVFAIDRTEVSNAAYAPFAKLSPLTGYTAPIYPTDPPLERSKDPDQPTTGVDAFDARAFCRYLGKELTTDPQWVKAARGGLEVGGKPNEHPRRRYPWGPVFQAACVNQEGDADGSLWVAPVGSFPCGASPYGVLDLVGNVDEWIARRDAPDAANPLQVIRGGAADAPPEMELTTTLFVNRRNPRDFRYSIGFRCVRVEGG